MYLVAPILQQMGCDLYGYLRFGVTPEWILATKCVYTKPLQNAPDVRKKSLALHRLQF